MRIELVMVVITVLCIANIYYNGILVKWVMKQKKYAQMIGILFLSFSIYLMIKRNPSQAKNILLHANNYVKYMPVNKNTVDQFSNILDFTHTNEESNSPTNNQSFISQMNTMFETNLSTTDNPKTMVQTTVTQKHKRAVSETKKKYIASMQDWKCGNCHSKLNAWYEIDHKKRLEYGGTNNVDNLIALCRECHGEKTAMENM